MNVISNLIFTVISYEWIKELIFHLSPNKVDKYSILYNNDLWYSLTKINLIEIYHNKYNINFTNNFINSYKIFQHNNLRGIKPIRDLLINKLINVNQNVHIDLITYEVDLFLKKIEFINKDAYIIRHINNNHNYYQNQGANFNIDNTTIYPKSFDKTYRKIFRKYFTYYPQTQISVFDN